MTNDELIRVLATHRTHLNTLWMVIDDIPSLVSEEGHGVYAMDMHTFYAEADRAMSCLSDAVGYINNMIKNLGGRP